MHDLVDAVRQLIDCGKVGLFHVVNPGAVSPYQIMRRYAFLIDPRHVCTPISTARLDQVTRARRSNCLLATDKLAAAGMRLRAVHEAVDGSLRQIACPEEIAWRMGYVDGETMQRYVADLPGDDYAYVRSLL